MISRNILIVEDDQALRELLCFNFTAEGFEVRATGSGAVALIMVQELAPDVILLDWSIDEIPGIEVCRQLSRDDRTSHIPIVMLTARTDEEACIRGLETGADDFVIKPFSPREIVARINALLRRTRTVGGKSVKFADLVLDPIQHRARRNGRTLYLAPKEFRLLAHFMERPRRVFTREQLLDAVWGISSNVGARVVDVYIRRLRKAINLPGEIDPIRTIREAGYAIDIEESAEIMPAPRDPVHAKAAG